MNKEISFISVDFQNEFATFGGKFFSPKPSADFLKDRILPTLLENKIKINEIVSDYRQPRQGDRGDGCHPGSWGYESIIPNNLRKSLWIKSMNSPVWVRENIGIPNKKPGLPYPDPELFNKWLVENVGKPEDIQPVLIGLTIDCCVLSTAQELSFRGYSPWVLKEGVDHASGKILDRDKILETPIPNWAKVISWDDLKLKLG